MTFLSRDLVVLLLSANHSCRMMPADLVDSCKERDKNLLNLPLNCSITKYCPKTLYSLSKDQYQLFSSTFKNEIWR